MFGPRGVGKSTWLTHAMPTALRIDLLRSSTYLQLQNAPGSIEAMVSAVEPGAWVIIDEVQKVPLVLDEVHRLLTERGLRFALCGSSARKLRRSGTNLLGGRALTRTMEGLTSRELGNRWDLRSALAWGTLPTVALDQANAADLLSSYVQTYLNQEIREEGAVRRLAPFVRFLTVAGQMNAKVLNLANVSRDAMVPRSSVEGYFNILSDTLLGHHLPGYRPRPKVREQSHPKFYWFDPGVARAAAGRLYEPEDRLWLGDALETIIFHELRVFNETAGRHRQLFYNRTATGEEIDFVIETRKATDTDPAAVVCVEVKLSERWDRKWERPMRSMKASGTVDIQRMFGVYTGPDRYRFDDVDVLPVAEFLKLLWDGGVF